MPITRLLHSHRGVHRDFNFELLHNPDPSLGDGHGTWTYYVILREPQVPNFDSLWLPPIAKVHDYISYDYDSTWVAELDWHGGVTFYKKHGEISGHRCIEFGCDYSHIYDVERNFDYTLDEVLADCLHTIDEIVAHILSNRMENTGEEGQQNQT